MGRCTRDYVEGIGSDFKCTICGNTWRGLSEIWLQERVLGRTGLTIRRVGFGGIPIQRLSTDEAVAVVRRAFELGVNFFDTARVYTTSEARIGEALEGVRDEAFIATKSVHRDKAGLLEDLETRPKEPQDGLHRPLPATHDIQERGMGEGPGARGALEGLLEAKDEGKINHLGITSHDPS